MLSKVSLQAEILLRSEASSKFLCVPECLPGLFLCAVKCQFLPFWEQELLVRTLAD